MQTIEENKTSIILQFDGLLKSYAEALGLRRDSFSMEAAEEMLLEIRKKTVGENYSRQVLVALAGVVGNLTVLSFVSYLEQFSFWVRGGGLNRVIRDTETEVIEVSAKWLKKNSEYSLGESKFLLKKLLNQHYPIQGKVK